MGSQEPISPPAPQASIEIVTGAAELDGLAREWDNLFGQTPLASGFESHAWVAGCWARNRTPSAQLYVCVVRIDGQTVALIPTQVDGGTVQFIGRSYSNYSGPVFSSQHLQGAILAWADHLAADPRVRAIDLGGLRGGLPFTELAGNGLPYWGSPVVAESNVCPEVDLTPGWDAVYRRHKPKTRSVWRRQEERMSLIGEVAVDLFTQPGEVSRVLPGLFPLWQAHFRGQRVSGGFTREHQDFQTHMAEQVAAAGLVELWVMRLDGEVIAFSYGIRGRDSTTSYIIAFEDALAAFSPGKLLLLRVLERAATNHDPVYDFSLGEASYKAQWATRTRPVYRMLWGRHAGWHAAHERAWVRARSIPWLHALKVGGLTALRKADPLARAPDTPGLAAGGSAGTLVYEIRHDTPPDTLRQLRFAEMRALLSPRLLRVAGEAAFRGDAVCAVERDGHVLGVVFRAAETRRKAVAGAWAEQLEGVAVYYRLLAKRGESVAGLASALPGPCLLLSAAVVPDARLLGENTPERI